MLELEDNGDTTYKGEVVARRYDDGDHYRVEIKLTYKVAKDSEMDWIVPLSWLGRGLRLIEPPKEPAVLTVATAEDATEMAPDAARMLVEKEFKGGGYTWVFHKSDADTWPSELHGHDYEQHLKIDAITGGIFNPTTKERVGALKQKHLKELHGKIRGCKDLQHRVALLPPPDDK